MAIWHRIQLWYYRWKLNRTTKKLEEFNEWLEREKIMKEYFVSFELAKKLKKKGYPQSILGKYDMKGACYFEDGRFYEDGCIAYVEDCCTAPTIEQALRWLRDEKKIHVATGVTPKSMWRYVIMFCDERGLQEPTIVETNYQDYPSAIVAGIEYTLDNLI